MAPGKYNLYVKLLELSNQASYNLRDFFYDDDMFQGVKTWPLKKSITQESLLPELSRQRQRSYGVQK